MSATRTISALFVFCATFAAAAPSAAKGPQPTVVVAPFTSSSGAEYQWIGSALSESLTARLVSSKEANVFSHRQWAAVLRDRDIAALTGASAEDAAAVAKQLGADEFVVGTYEASWPFITVVAKRVEAKTGKTLEETRTEGQLADLLKAEAAVAKGLFNKAYKKAAKAKAPTRKLMAWRSLALCRDGMSMQSLSARAKLWLPKGAAKAALAHCEDALKADKGLHEAAAFGALARYAMDRDDKAKRAKALKDARTAAKKRKVPGWADQIAFFLSRREGDNKGAYKALEAAVKKAPGLLHARTTLGESMLDDGDVKGAQKVFEASLARAPNQPWSLVQLGKIKAKGGDIDGALAETEKAIGLVGDDAVLLMEKASRQIDGKRWKDAEGTLRQAMAKDPRLAAAYLRLGYVYLETDQRALAGPILKKAIYEADRQSERRVRAYAYFDLAKLAAREGKTDDAFAQITKAKRAGLKDRGLYEKDVDLKALTSDKRFQAVFSSP